MFSAHFSDVQNNSNMLLQGRSSPCVHCEGGLLEDKVTVTILHGNLMLWGGKG